MKTDIKGVSQCPAGQESYETYIPPFYKGELVAYDYRTPEGELFSCIRPTLEKCREKRDMWLRYNQKIH